MTRADDVRGEVMRGGRGATRSADVRRCRGGHPRWLRGRPGRLASPAGRDECGSSSVGAGGVRRAHGGQQPDPHRCDQRLGAVRSAELLVDVPDVRLGRRLAREEPFGDRRRPGPSARQGRRARGRRPAATAGRSGRPAWADCCRRRTAVRRPRAEPYRTTSWAGRLAHEAGRTGLHGAKIWSSPECIVSTTSPVDEPVRRTARTMSSPVPSGSWRSATTTSGARSAYAAIGVGDGPRLPRPRGRARGRRPRPARCGSARGRRRAGRWSCQGRSPRCGGPARRPALPADRVADGSDGAARAAHSEPGP